MKFLRWDISHSDYDGSFAYRGELGPSKLEFDITTIKISGMASAQAGSSHGLYCGLPRTDGGFEATIEIDNNYMLASQVVEPVCTWRWNRVRVAVRNARRSGDVHANQGCNESKARGILLRFAAPSGLLKQRFDRTPGDKHWNNKPFDGAGQNKLLDIRAWIGAEPTGLAYR